MVMNGGWFSIAIPTLRDSVSWLIAGEKCQELPYMPRSACSTMRVKNDKLRIGRPGTSCFQVEPPKTEEKKSYITYPELLENAKS